MRNYRIDELNPGDVSRIRKALDSRELSSSLGDLYWLPLPPELLTDCQSEHAKECGPHSVGIECGEDFLNMELLVRARGRIRCDCIAYVTPDQRAWVMDWLDSLLRELDIPA